MRRPAAHLLAALALFLPAALRAQKAPPPRPELPAAADTNDWEAYYDQGTALLQRRMAAAANAHYYWASRLDPRRAEPLFGRWVAFWASDAQRYERWLDDRPEVVRAPDVLAMDTVRSLAWDRNPLVFQGQQLLIFEQLRGDWRQDPVTQGMLAYAQLQFPRAHELFQRAIDRDRAKNAWVRYDRALVYTAEAKYDSAQRQMELLLADLRTRDSTAIERSYLSKAFVEYTIGRLLYARGDRAGAADAFGRALGEDLAFTPAHEWMAQVALDRGDGGTAVTELRQAVELRGQDGVLRWELGRALGATGADSLAVVELRQAVALEPFFAEPWLSLALALDRQGSTEEAVASYRAYLARAPRAAPGRARAAARLEQLAANGAK